MAQKKASAKVVPMDNQRLVTIWLFVIAAVIFLGGLWAWYQYVHRSKYGVFWDTIDNNLNIYGVTRNLQQNQGAATYDQKLQLSLGAQNVARGITTIEQPSAQGGTTTVVSETIGTPTNNFSRYTDIDTGSEVNASEVINVWGQELLVEGQQQNQSVFAEALFSSIPFAQLSLSQRQELVEFMKENEVYKTDYKGAKTVEREGKQAYEYTVEVNLKGYIEVLKKIDEMMGLGQLEGIDPAAYDGAEPAQLTVIASIDGRQLLEVNYPGAGRIEKYSSYGARIPVEIPETNLQRAELEQKIQELFTPTTSSQ